MKGSGVGDFQGRGGISCGVKCHGQRGIGSVVLSLKGGVCVCVYSSGS